MLSLFAEPLSREDGLTGRGSSWMTPHLTRGTNPSHPCLSSPHPLLFIFSISGKVYQSPWSRNSIQSHPHTPSSGRPSESLPNNPAVNWTDWRWPPMRAWPSIKSGLVMREWLQLNQFKCFWGWWLCDAVGLGIIIQKVRWDHLAIKLSPLGVYFHKYVYKALLE